MSCGFSSGNSRKSGSTMLNEGSVPLSVLAKNWSAVPAIRKRRLGNVGPRHEQNQWFSIISLSYAMRVCLRRSGVIHHPGGNGMYYFLLFVSGESPGVIAQAHRGLPRSPSVEPGTDPDQRGEPLLLETGSFC